MNRLELQIFESFRYLSSDKDRARVAAKIALEVAEKAFYTGCNVGEEDISRWDSYYKDFKQEIL